MSEPKLKAAESGTPTKQIVTSSCSFLFDACSGRLLRPLSENLEYELVATLDDFERGASAEGAAEWLTAEQAAPLMGVDPQYLYRHWRKLPFAKKFSPKCLRFAKRGILARENREVKR